MPKGKPALASMSSITDARAKLVAQMAELKQREKAVRQKERDAGRKVLLAALDKVKISAMSGADAKVIAEAIGARSASDIVAALESSTKAESAAKVEPEPVS